VYLYGTQAEDVGETNCATVIEERHKERNKDRKEERKEVKRGKIKK
jgi:hypothetical protein